MLGDVEQLVRQQELAPVTIVAHFRWVETIASLFAGLYPAEVKKMVLN